MRWSHYEQELDQCYSDEWDCPTDSAKFLKKKESERVYLFLTGLDKIFDEVQSRILGRKPVSTLREAFLEIRREETRRRGMMSSQVTAPIVVENSAFAVAKKE